jgi:DNA-binding transcriptional ArsR family regulator
MLATMETLFSSMARVKILHLFLLNPSSQFYQREIERETEQPIRAVQREVERLEGIGLLARSKEGNRVFYQVNPEFALLEELTALFERAFGAKRTKEATEGLATTAPEPWSIQQPFPWMETPPVPPLPSRLREIQVDGEWDQAY